MQKDNILQVYEYIENNMQQSVARSGIPDFTVDPAGSKRECVRQE